MRARSILLGLAMVGVLLSSAGSLGGCHARVYPNRIYAHRPYRHHYYRSYRYSPPYRPYFFYYARPYCPRY